MAIYSAEMYADDGQNNYPPTTLVKVRFQPPVDITEGMMEVDGAAGLVVEHYASTRDASVYNLWVKDEGRPDNTHQQRVKRAAEFVKDVLDDVNEINDLTDDTWAEGLQRVAIEGQE